MYYRCDTYKRERQDSGRGGKAPRGSAPIAGVAVYNIIADFEAASLSSSRDPVVRGSLFFKYEVYSTAQLREEAIIYIVLCEFSDFFFQGECYTYIAIL